MNPYGNGQILTPKINGCDVVGVQRDQSTRGITAFKLSDGRILDSSTVANAISGGQCEGLMVQSNQYGSFIRTKPDGSAGNNLDSLPSF